jgi:putative membrane-bound dehydrogenase-like protein
MKSPSFFRIPSKACVVALSVFAAGPASAEDGVPEFDQQGLSKSNAATQGSAKFISWAPGALPPEEAVRELTPGEGLAVDLVASEPVIEQPLFLNFDARGRMWVVQFRQYPHPAGLKIVSRDSVWRNVYDKVPPPPPHSPGSLFRGEDKITIHEDTDGDGTYDKTKTFLDGLNMATSLAHGRGGVWVMNPPYLMFYPDKDGDDVPDGDPTVHLKGFWLEDSHSISNSLRWGPDGWLYGAQGSTVSADIVIVGKDDGAKPIHTQGQQIWRYHPERRVFETYAEGGGNAFGCEIDEKGRVFSGHNGGNTRGFHYVQGAYLQKNFGKHGSLSNPYAFGYFPQMPHPNVARFTHNFIVYEGGSLPQKYHGKLIGIDPMNRYLPVAERMVDGATFRTKDVAAAIEKDGDPWFRPVDIKHGPDGAIYIADWYDAQVNHYRNHEGKIDKENGRIYRIRAAEGHQTTTPFDLREKSTSELIELLKHSNRWYREQARRLIGDRRDATAIAALKEDLFKADGQEALEYLWALNLSGGFDEDLAVQALDHADPYVRTWTVRLLADKQTISGTTAAKLAVLAKGESHVEVRSQLAASAKRLPVEAAFPIVAELLRHDEDEKDRYLPLQIWWAIESKCSSDADAVVDVFEDPTLWGRPLVNAHILWRLMRRFAASGKRIDMERCARLLELSPDAGSKKRLMEGFEQAFKGRALTGLPPRLIKAIDGAGGASLTLRVRNGEKEAIDEALKISANKKSPLTRRVTFISLFAEIEEPRSVPVLLSVLGDMHATVRHAALTSLQSYRDEKIGREVISRYHDFDGATREVARTLLATRAHWSRQLVEAVTAGQIEKESFPGEQVAQIRLHQDAALQAKVEKVWGKLRAPTPGHFQKEIDRIQAILMKGKSNPYDGKPLFMNKCAACHKLFADGGSIGPDLTGYQRKDTGNMLLNIVNPNAEIREGYENYVVTMKDGRVIMGFKADEDNAVMVIRGMDGQSISLKREGIVNINAIGSSLMPRGLLSGMSDQQIRDFFAYFRTTQPLVGGKR